MCKLAKKEGNGTRYTLLWSTMSYSMILVQRQDNLWLQHSFTPVRVSVQSAVVGVSQPEGLFDMLMEPEPSHLPRPKEDNLLGSNSVN